ncbi:VOC family protein [Archangium sp.]|uniref:VOC family protein n=1 Tax=Archangium sp. TaxID=1872627 RepID=UPI00389AF62F
MSPAPQLCHVFVFIERGAPEAARLEAAGLRESVRRRHVGQGTANVCYCFDNAFLELVWAEDEAELTGPTVARTRLAERARWRETGASPFGIALRTAPDQPLPFPTWDYRPPYLPAGMAIPVALASEDPRQPMVFRSPGSARPDGWTDGRAGDRQRPAGLAEIIGIELDLPTHVPPGEALRRLAEAGLLTLGTSDTGQSRMVLSLSRVDGGPPRRLALPELRWLDPVTPR